jgi:trimeric autotransporter adhesin
MGVSSLYHNNTGSGNTAHGQNALLNNTGSNNIAVGSNAGGNLTRGSNNIDIGALGIADESNKIRIGIQGMQDGTFIAGIYNAAVTGSTVAVNANGKLGVTASSVRFKENIRPMDKASEAILALKPVTFRYKKEVDAERTPQFGLIAEEVEKVNPALVARDEQGKPYTVRYEAVNAMLLNEFLKEHRKVEQQRKDFEAALARQQKQIDVLTEGLQKVSAQLELSKFPPQTVANNQ